MRKIIHYIDTFAGMGGFRKELTRAGDFVCMGHYEIDKHAGRNYCALFDTEGGWFIAVVVTTIFANVAEDIIAAVDSVNPFEKHKITSFFFICQLACLNVHSLYRDSYVKCVNYSS